MLNKTDLARKFAQRTLFTKRESEQIIEVLFDTMVEELLSGNEINIVNFGKFVLYKQRPRPVRNPKTLEEMTLKEFLSIKFRTSTTLKYKVKNQ